MDDVETFNREHQATKAAKSHNNLFARQNWEEYGFLCVLNTQSSFCNYLSFTISHSRCSLDKDDIQDSAKAGHRISPYLSKISSAPSKTNANAVVVPKLEQPLGTGAFKDRCNNGSIQSILNDHIEVATTSTTTPCDIQILGHPIDINARYMMDRLANKAAYIHHRISTIESDIDASTAEGIPLPIGTAAQQKSLFVGRVCCDTEEGRLNPQSVLLEGSSTLSHGARVRVDLASCPEYRLFPGQVVVVRGTNPSGFCIAANNVLSGAPLPFNGSMDVDTVAMSTCIVASGPYTTTENLSYEPLAALLEHCKACQPDMLLLAGPFVDAEHPCLKDGLFEETFEEIFASRVLSQLASFSGAVGEKTKILLVPSPKDAHHDPVYPQRPMKVVQDDDGQEITTNLSNPSMFSCNGVVLGCSSVDWLMSCTKEEISRSEKPVDRLPTMAMHLVHQRRYFDKYTFFFFFLNVLINVMQYFIHNLQFLPHVSSPYWLTNGYHPWLWIGIFLHTKYPHLSIRFGTFCKEHAIEETCWVKCR